MMVDYILLFLQLLRKYDSFTLVIFQITVTVIMQHLHFRGLLCTAILRIIKPISLCLDLFLYLLFCLCTIFILFSCVLQYTDSLKQLFKKIVDNFMYLLFTKIDIAVLILGQMKLTFLYRFMLFWLKIFIFLFQFISPPPPHSSYSIPLTRRLCYNFIDYLWGFTNCRLRRRISQRCSRTTKMYINCFLY